MTQNEFLKVVNVLSNDNISTQIITNLLDKLNKAESNKMGECSGCANCTCKKNNAPIDKEESKVGEIKSNYLIASKKWNENGDKFLTTYKKSCINIIREILVFIKTEIGEELLTEIKKELRIDFSFGESFAIFFTDCYGIKYNIENLYSEDILEITHCIKQRIELYFRKNEKLNIKM